MSEQGERVVVLSDVQIEKLAAICEQEEASPALSSGTVPALLGEAGRQLRKALEQPRGEERVEYRVGFFVGQGEFKRLDPHIGQLLNRAVAESYRREYAARHPNVRIQQRTVVIQTPWQDIDQQEGDER